MDECRAFTHAVPVPVLANLTEFEKTPLFTVEELMQSRAELCDVLGYHAQEQKLDEIFAKSNSTPNP